MLSFWALIFFGLFSFIIVPIACSDADTSSNDADEEAEESLEADNASPLTLLTLKLNDNNRLEMKLNSESKLGWYTIESNHGKITKRLQNIDYINSLERDLNLLIGKDKLEYFDPSQFYAFTSSILDGKNISKDPIFEIFSNSTEQEGIKSGDDEEEPLDIEPKPLLEQIMKIQKEFETFAFASVETRSKLLELNSISRSIEKVFSDLEIIDNEALSSLLENSQKILEANIQTARDSLIQGKFESSQLIINLRQKLGKYEELNDNLKLTRIIGDMRQLFKIDPNISNISNFLENYNYNDDSDDESLKDSNFEDLVFITAFEKCINEQNRPGLLYDIAFSSIPSYSLLPKECKSIEGNVNPISKYKNILSNHGFNKPTWIDTLNLIEELENFSISPSQEIIDLEQIKNYNKKVVILKGELSDIFSQLQVNLLEFYEYFEELNSRENDKYFTMIFDSILEFLEGYESKAFTIENLFNLLMNIKQSQLYILSISGVLVDIYLNEDLITRKKDQNKIKLELMNRLKGVKECTEENYCSSNPEIYANINKWKKFKEIKWESIKGDFDLERFSSISFEFPTLSSKRMNFDRLFKIHGKLNKVIKVLELNRKKHNLKEEILDAFKRKGGKFELFDENSKSTKVPLKPEIASTLLSIAWGKMALFKMNMKNSNNDLGDANFNLENINSALIDAFECNLPKMSYVVLRLNGIQKFILANLNIKDQNIPLEIDDIRGKLRKILEIKRFIDSNQEFNKLEMDLALVIHAFRHDDFDQKFIKLIASKERTDEILTKNSLEAKQIFYQNYVKISYLGGKDDKLERFHILLLEEESFRKKLPSSSQSPLFLKEQLKESSNSKEKEVLKKLRKHVEGSDEDEDDESEILSNSNENNEFGTDRPYLTLAGTLKSNSSYLSLDEMSKFKELLSQNIPFVMAKQQIIKDLEKSLGDNIENLFHEYITRGYKNINEILFKLETYNKIKDYDMKNEIIWQEVYSKSLKSIPIIKFASKKSVKLLLEMSLDSQNFADIYRKYDEFSILIKGKLKELISLLLEGSEKGKGIKKETILKVLERLELLIEGERGEKVDFPLIYLNIRAIESRFSISIMELLNRIEQFPSMSNIIMNYIKISDNSKTRFQELGEFIKNDKKEIIESDPSHLTPSIETKVENLKVRFKGYVNLLKEKLDGKLENLKDFLIVIKSEIEQFLLKKRENRKRNEKLSHSYRYLYDSLNTEKSLTRNIQHLENLIKAIEEIKNNYEISKMSHHFEFVSDIKKQVLCSYSIIQQMQFEELGILVIEAFFNNGSRGMLECFGRKLEILLNIDLEMQVEFNTEPNFPLPSCARVNFVELINDLGLGILMSSPSNSDEIIKALEKFKLEQNEKERDLDIIAFIENISKFNNESKLKSIIEHVNRMHETKGIKSNLTNI